MDVVFTSSNPFRQRPRCEGIYQGRTLFNAKVSAGRLVRYPIHVDQGCKYVIPAGLAHGVSYGVEFTLYGDQKQRQTVIMVDNTALVEDFQTTVTTSVYFANDAFAKLTRVGKLPFHLSPGGNPSLPLKETLQRMSENSTHAANFQLVESVEGAKLEVVVDGQHAVFNILDRRVNKFGLTRLPHRAVTLGSIVHILNTAAHYYWYLDLKNKNSLIATRNQIAVDFYSLLSDYDDYGVQFYLPIGPGYCRNDQHLDGTNVIEFVVDPMAVYGFKITNNTPWDLYLNAFLFNNASLSIGEQSSLIVLRHHSLMYVHGAESYYTQPSNGNQEPPLKRNGTLHIGYGHVGMPPFAYSLEEGQDVDVGYLKIFFATRPIDLSELVRTSPFTDTEGRDLEEEIARKAKLALLPPTQAPTQSEPVDVWFTVEIPVVQRR